MFTRLGVSLCWILYVSVAYSEVISFDGLRNQFSVTGFQTAKELSIAACNPCHNSVRSSAVLQSIDAMDEGARAKFLMQALTSLNMPPDPVFRAIYALKLRSIVERSPELHE
jgi:hypothetical protein